MANDKWTSESIFQLVDDVEVHARASEVAFGEVDKTISCILATMKEAGVSDERLRTVRCWALFHNAFVNDLHRLAGAESGLTTIFEEKSRNLGRMIACTTMKDVQDSGVFVPRGKAEAQDDPLAFMDEEEDAAEVAGQAEEAQSDKALFANVVKLMAKAGTRRHGLKAGWTIEEIQYGLMVAMPGVPDDAVVSALARLKNEGVVEVFNKNNPGVHIYCLVDDYADLMGQDSELVQEKPEVDKEGELLRGLHGVLQSNTGANGKLVSWKLGSLFYALRDQHPWITKADVTAAASAAQWCEEVTPGVYRWAEVESATAQVVESVEPEPVKKQPVGVVEAADAIYGVLKAEAASGQRRIWKEYDILGFLGRGVELGGNLRAEHLSQGLLNAAINFLVVEGRLEVVPPSPERPWIKQPGWRIAR